MLSAILTALRHRREFADKARRTRPQYVWPTICVGLGFISVVLSPARAVEIDVSLLPGGNGTDGFVLLGDQAGDRAGRSVHVAGDINDDGIDDILVGAPFARYDSQSTSGQAYLLFGQPTGFQGQIELSSLPSGDGSLGFVLYGERIPATGVYAPVGNAGIRVSGGDINGDAVNDLIVASTGTKSVYVVFGHDGTNADFPPEFDLGTLAIGDGSEGFIFRGPAILSGHAGDLNQDNVSDLAVSVGYEHSDTYVVYGRSAAMGGFPPEYTVDEWRTAIGESGYRLSAVDEFDNSGTALDAGDVNGDGLDDLVIGAPHASPDYHERELAGSAYIVFGASTATGEPRTRVSLFSLGQSAPPDGFTVSGDDVGDTTARDVSVGDINGDGVADVILGAPGANPNGVSNAGATYVVFGRSGGTGAFPTTLNVASLINGDGSIGFVIAGDREEDQIGNRVATGDINGDGIEDVIVGTKSIGRTTNHAYVIYGRDAAAGSFPAELLVSSLTDTTGLVITGLRAIGTKLSPISGIGQSVDSGDLNGDGIDDVIIGDSEASVDENEEAGIIYVIFGRAVD